MRALGLSSPAGAQCFQKKICCRREGAVLRVTRCRDGPTAEKERKSVAQDDPDEVARKYGLEAGIFKAWTNRNKDSGKSVTAKDLLKRYGGAYLMTSISLAIVSFALCYVAVDAGVDVAALLTRLGITMSENNLEERAGTVALAYAAHKALSPVRFPPTVLLTPIVANALGKGDDGPSEP